MPSQVYPDAIWPG
jgi:transposase